MYKTIALLSLVSAFLVYSIHLYSSLPQYQNQANREADKGKLIWQKYNCNACHQIYGLGGYLGPDITNVYSMRGEHVIRALLQHGSRVMPVFQCSEIEINQLIAFLKLVDESGKSDPTTFKTHRNGTIEQ